MNNNERASGSGSSPSSPPPNSPRGGGAGGNPQLLRLADYFIVAGYNDQHPQVQERGPGALFQRFPVVDWPDEQFIETIELYQPRGWALTTEPKEPSFCTGVMTNALGVRRFWACLSFYEKYIPGRLVDEVDEEVVEGGDMRILIYPEEIELYAPKVLCIASRVNLTDIFRYSLATIYSAYLDPAKPKLEILIGNLLGQVMVPPPGGPQVRFSIGRGDLQIIQPPQTPTIPVTGTSVATLLHQIGINNLLMLFSAVLTEQKILFHSRSASRLYDACWALISIIYPFNWYHTFVPLLPTAVVNMVQSPTPYIIGIFSDTLPLITETMTDVILVDLDGGSMHVPDLVQDPVSRTTVTKRESTKIKKSGPRESKKGKSKMASAEVKGDSTADVTLTGAEEADECSQSVVSRVPQILWTQSFEQLTDILHPELASCDHAFPPLAIKSAPPFQLDKEIRAVFLRLLANLLQGYRSCLILVRIHPVPVIKFHQAKFLGGRGLRKNQFVINFLNSQSFSQFITERGPPFRPVDLWDEYYATLENQLTEEEQDPRTFVQHLAKTVEDLSENECPNGQPYAPKLPRPPDPALLQNAHFSTFPTLDPALVDETIREGLARHLGQHSGTSLRNQPKRVPVGPRTLHLLENRTNLVDNSARRLEVIRKCIAYIFSNNIVLASKSIHAVKKALGSKAAKLVLCEELSRHGMSANVALLDRQQFDLVVLLMQCALQGTTETDEEGVAAALLPIATTFCRKLCTGVIQFAYSCIQDYPVWKNPNFWEDTFYADVQHDLIDLYKSQPQPGSSSSINNAQSNHTERVIETENNIFSALEIAAEQLRLTPTIEPERLREMGVSDELTVVSQAMHYVNRMVYLITPLEESQMRHHAREHHHYHHMSSSAGDNVSMVASVAESDDVESVREDHVVDVGGMVTKLVGRFVDKVASEGGVTDTHLRNLNNLVPSVVEMHLETLEAVSRQLKRLKPIPKPPIPSPQFVPGEELVMDSIRAFLNIDGREFGETVGGTVSDIPSNLNKSPIPAEGAVFFTNYRIIFKGSPMDQNVSMSHVVRALPIAAITKEKWNNAAIEFGSKAQEKVTIRSATSELLKLVFDEDVSAETLDTFRKTLQKLRYPPDIFKYFAFVGHANPPGSPYTVAKDKNQTLKVFAKKTLMMTAKKVGVKPKGNGKKNKYALKGWVPGSSGTLPPNTKYGQSSMIGSLAANEDEGSDDESMHSPTAATLTPLYRDLGPAEIISFERLLDRSYAKDWKRLGFGMPVKQGSASAAQAILNRADNMRFSYANTNYLICQSHPAILVVPHSVTDESMKRLTGGFNGGKVPVVTWRHPTTKALLLRGAAMNSRGFAPRVFGGQKTSGSGAGEGGQLDFDNFLRFILHATPGNFARSGSVVGLIESAELGGSLESVFKHAGNRSSVHGHGHGHTMESLQNTPDTGRKGHRPKHAMDTLRSAATAVGNQGSKGLKNLKIWSNTVLPKKSPQGSQGPKMQFLPTPSGGGQMMTSIKSEDDIPRPETPRFPALYVFIDKAKVKSWKMDSWLKIDYVAVHQSLDLGKVRAAFKTLQRACLPSTPIQRSEDSFVKAIERSGWLRQVQTLMRHSGAVLDLMDIQGSSVMLCLGDGSDTAAQISSLAQLCLDSFYRTMDGFTVLLEKEWFAFGHKFSERNDVTGIEGHKNKENITPIFIQFLDAVHQIMLQYPSSFEFNQTYLKFLGYHSVSGRFRTFFLDSEFERMSVGFVSLDDRRNSMKRHGEAVELPDNEGRPNSNGIQQNPMGESLFDYIARVNCVSARFYNFAYDKRMDSEILRPYSNYPNLEIWDFFTEDSLGSGSPYDLEICAIDDSSQTEPEQHAIEGLERRSIADGSLHQELVQSRNEVRDVVTIGSSEESADRAFPDAFNYHISEISKLEVITAGGSSRSSWTWRQSEPNVMNPFGAIPRVVSRQPFNSRSPSMSPGIKLLLMENVPSRSQIRRDRLAIHKKATVDILIQGKGGRGSEINTTASSHSFIKRPFTSFEMCVICSTILLGKMGLQCSQCGACCHEGCVEFIPACYITPGFPATDEVAAGGSHASPGFGTMALGGIIPDPETYYMSFRSHAMESVALSGYLSKRGALLKAWKPRWFTLDTTKHELRYYEYKADVTPKGCIDLSEVKKCDYQDAVIVDPADPSYKTVFELKTNRRIYILGAKTHAETAEWVERIQGLISA